jgi:hypothetical protein
MSKYTIEAGLVGEAKNYGTKEFATKQAAENYAKLMAALAYMKALRNNPKKRDAMPKISVKEAMNQNSEKVKALREEIMREISYKVEEVKE